MRKIVLSLAAAGAALAAASPAVAQYYPAPQPVPYGHGVRGNFGEVRALQQRIDNVQRQIARLDRRDAIRGRAADRLMDESRGIERRLYDKARNGLDPREAGDIQYRIQRLEQRVQFALNDRGWDRDRRW
ncbi:MAG TPA: hypothetical protein VF098_09735 [Sphingomicrobium sp.]|jgi:hypothetical protein